MKREPGAALALAILIVMTVLVSFLIVSRDDARTQRDDAEARYVSLTNEPAPTVTATVKQRITLTPKPVPAKTVEVTVRVTERASRSNVRETARTLKSAGGNESPFTGWKARYWAEGQRWAQQPKTRAVIMCESTDRVSAVSSTGKYHGLYQFDRGTWASYGGLELAPLASQATRAEQNYVGYRLFVGRGWSPWSCA